MVISYIEALRDLRQGLDYWDEKYSTVTAKIEIVAPLMRKYQKKTEKKLAKVQAKVQSN